MATPTKRQKQILDYLTKYISENGYSPTFEEIRRHFKLSAPSTVHQHIEALLSKGFLTRNNHSARGVELSKSGSNLIEIAIKGTIAAGEPIEAIEIPDSSVSIPKEEINLLRNHYALRVKGDSMIKEGIFDGDIVIIRQQKIADNGQTVVAIIDDNEATLKKLYREGNRFRLQPANPTFLPIYRNEVEIRGLVVKIIRNFDNKTANNQHQLLNKRFSISKNILLIDIYNNINLKSISKQQLLDILFSFFSKPLQINNTLEDYIYKSISNNNHVDLIKLIQLIGITHQKEKEKKKLYNTNERKHFGIYYTDYQIAEQIIIESLQGLTFKQLLEKKFLEPCAGNGIFIIAYIDYLFKINKNCSQHDLQKVLNNIYCADIDDEAIELLKIILKKYIYRKYNYQIKLVDNNYYIGDLLFDINGSQIIKIDPRNIFNVKDGFDIIITNPPYKLLKANGDKYGKKTNNGYHEQIKNIIQFIKNNNFYKYNQGTLNYYKLFVEEIIENYSHDDSRIGLLIPITLLNDLQSEKLRKRIFYNYKISNIYIIPEKNKFFPDITQSFCFFGINKSYSGDNFSVVNDVDSINKIHNDKIDININDLINISSTIPIIAENSIGWKILNKISKHNKIKQLLSINNLRGELDLTLDKKYVTNEATSYPLLKGININEFNFSKSNKFIKEEFIAKLSSKSQYIKQERLVCQQISNINSDKRLKFVKVPKGFILGNSCNFISKENKLQIGDDIKLDYLLGLLNSYLLDWRFNLTNSNNHISNYELNDLPIAHTNKKNIEYICQLVKNINSTDIKRLSKLNILVFKIYNISKNEIKHVFSKYKQNELITYIIKQTQNYAL
ncbi:transcriptional repressor LexA [Patescibacteria group bacterium]